MVLMERRDKPPHRRGLGVGNTLGQYAPAYCPPKLGGTSEAEGVSYTPKVYYSEIK